MDSHSAIQKQHLIEKYYWNDYPGMESQSARSTAGITTVGKPRPAPIMKASHAFESLLFEFEHDCQSLLLKPKYNRHLRTKGTNAPCDSFFYGAITNASDQQKGTVGTLIWNQSL